MDEFEVKLEVKVEKLITETRLSMVFEGTLGNTKIVVKTPQKGKEPHLEEAIKIYELLGPHKNLHEYLGRIYINKKPALLLKYFEGKNITEKIDEIKGDFNKTLKVLYQFLNVVEYIKSKGVFYLDDFIRNTMIDENLQLKLGDFNFSKINKETLNPNIILKSNTTLTTTEEYEKIDRIHIGDFIYFLFTGITPNQRYNKPIQKINKKLKRELLIEVDKIIGKFWYSKGDFKISDIINEFKNLEIKYGNDWEATNKKTKKRTKKSKGVKKSDNVEDYKKLEPGKFVRVKGWAGLASAEEIINESQGIIVGQNEQTFIEKLYTLCREDQFILDLVGTVDRKKITGKYQGVCW